MNEVVNLDPDADLEDISRSSRASTSKTYNFNYFNNCQHYNSNLHLEDGEFDTISLLVPTRFLCPSLILIMLKLRKADELMLFSLHTKPDVHSEACLGVVR